MSRVAAPNLTRADARTRAEMLDVDSYTVSLDLTDGAAGPGETTFRSTTTVRFRCTSPGAASWIDIVAAGVRSASLNGVALDVTGYDEEKGIALPDLAAENELVVDADCRYMNTGEGLHRFVDPVDGGVYLYSQFETADAKRMFACFDQPDLKATITLTALAAPDWEVISNGAKDTTTTLESGAVHHAFETTVRISTYLVALIAGPYAKWTDEYADDHGTIPLGIYCRASLAEHMDADRLFTETKQGFGFYHRNFGVPYPFTKYDQLFVPEFNAGAMENVGAVTFLEDYVFRSRVTRYLYERRAETVLHEMAHMWFGDLVTMRWWDDLWLNESFATWASVVSQSEATEYRNAWTTFANVEKSWAYRQDQLPSTHPIAADIPDLQAVEVNFDGITYAKGASVLKQLVSYVGQDEFLAGLRLYFSRHAYGNATFDDLLGALTEASGRDLSGWSAEWLRTTGLNSLSPSFAVGADGRYTSFDVTQGGARPGAGETRTHRIAVGIYDDDGSGKLVRRHRTELDVSGERTAVPELVGVEAGALVLVNDDDLTYCTMRLDERSLTTLIDRVGDIAEPLPRTLCWSAAWEMTREAELRARDFVTLVLNGLRRRERGRRRAAAAAAGADGARVLRRADVGGRAGVALVRRDAARPREARRAGLGPPARPGELAGRVGAHPGGAGGDRRLAGGDRAARGARRRHRPALAAAARAGRPRGRGRRGGRGGARAGQHRDRAAHGRAGPGAGADPGGQGHRVGAGGLRRHAAQRDQHGDHHGLLAPVAGRAADPVHREVLRRGRRGVGPALVRAGPAHGAGPLPVLGRRAGDGGRRRPLARRRAPGRPAPPGLRGARGHRPGPRGAGLRPRGKLVAPSRR